MVQYFISEIISPPKSIYFSELDLDLLKIFSVQIITVSQGSLPQAECMKQLELGTSTLVEDGQGPGLHHDERDRNTWDGIELITDFIENSRI